MRHGNALVYSTFVNGADIAAIAVDASGNAYTTGVATAWRQHPDVSRPTSRLGLALCRQAQRGRHCHGVRDIPGRKRRRGRKSTAIAVDASGSAYVTGQTYTADFPTQNAMQPSRRGERDAFVAKLNPEGSALVYSTYLGGTERETGNGIAVDASGQAFVVGYTYSANFPVTPGAFQTRKGSEGFVLCQWFRGQAAGGRVGSGLLIVSWRPLHQLFRSSDGDGAKAIAIDSAGYAYVGGWAHRSTSPRSTPSSAMDRGVVISGHPSFPR